MKHVHKSSSDKLATLASKVLRDEKSSKNAKKLAGSVLSQHEKEEKVKEED